MIEGQASTIDKKLQELMTLTPQQRMELAERLVESVPPTFGDPDIAEAWRAEIARRVKEAKEGLVEPIPAQEVHARLEEKYGITSE